MTNYTSRQSYVKYSRLMAEGTPFLEIIFHLKLYLTSMVIGNEEVGVKLNGHLNIGMCQKNQGGSREVYITYFAETLKKTVCSKKKKERKYKFSPAS